MFVLPEVYLRILRDCGTNVQVDEKGTPFEWTPEQEAAFQELKSRLTEAPILGMPTSDGVFTVDTDASNIGVGVVLSQQQGDSEVVLA